MNGSIAFDINKTQTPTTAYMSGGNPFQGIETKNYETRVLTTLHLKSVQSSVLQAFHAWDETVCVRLRQLIEAIMPELRQKPYLSIFRLLSKNNFFWMMLGRKVRYRIVRNRREGTWALQLFKKNAYVSIASHDLVKVRFILDDRSYPISFHLCRGSDNQMFSTTSLSEDELTRFLVCHFSRLSCGSNLESDLDYLKFLHDRDMISTMDYVAEKRNLLTPRAATHLYILPVKPAHVVLRKEARLRLAFTVYCAVLLAAILLCAIKYSKGEFSSSAPQAEFLKPRLSL